jgi:dihydroorotase
MNASTKRHLLAFALQLPPSKARMVVGAVAAKEKETATPAAGEFDAALEAMAEVMEQRIADELLQQFLTE